MLVDTRLTLEQYLVQTSVKNQVIVAERVCQRVSIDAYELVDNQVSIKMLIECQPSIGEDVDQVLIEISIEC